MYCKKRLFNKGYCSLFWGHYIQEYQQQIELLPRVVVVRTVADKNKIEYKVSLMWLSFYFGVRFGNVVDVTYRNL